MFPIRIKFDLKDREFNLFFNLLFSTFLLITQYLVIFINYLCVLVMGDVVALPTSPP